MNVHKAVIHDGRKFFPGFGDLIGQSPPMEELFDMIRKVAFGNANILIAGESGVGKELVAR
ncbi:MAG: sigma 54-interacting transcriptional regulator, partial [Calditrichaeota bacterium]|nr:sigma 54-interacting transcriptional regulator [Calditrichota bacterium]